MCTCHDNLIIIVAGDTNKRSLCELLSDTPELVIVPTPPTRGTAVLDEIATNIPDNITECVTMPPLQSETGTYSDHDIVLLSTKISSTHHFTKRSFKHRPITEKGKEKFIAAIVLTDWTFMMRDTSSESANALCQMLDGLVADCFPEVTTSIKSTDGPWISRGVRRRARRKRNL